MASHFVRILFRILVILIFNEKKFPKCRFFFFGSKAADIAFKINRKRKIKFFVK